MAQTNLQGHKNAILKCIRLADVSSWGCRQDNIKPIPPTRNHQNNSVILAAVTQLHTESNGWIRYGAPAPRVQPQSENNITKRLITGNRAA